MISHRKPTDDLELLLGPHQAEIMRLLWKHGPATVRQIHTWMPTEPQLAYTTVMNLCVRLVEKGFAERRQTTEAERSTGYGRAYVYAPLVTEEDVTRGDAEQSVGAAPIDRVRIEQVLAYLGTLGDAAGDRVDDSALDAIAALLERAEAAEHAAATWEARARQAELRVQIVERRARAAQRRAEKSEQELEALQKRMEHPPQTERKRRVLRGIIVEHQDPAGICRVCAQPAPPAHGLRKDGLRVCVSEECRSEARRRDTVAKQRRYIERRSAGQVLR